MIRYLQIMVIAFLLMAVADRYRDNLVIVPEDPHPCWTANETLEHARDIFEEFDNRDPVDDPRFDDPQLTHPGYKCDEHGQFTGDLMK